MFALNVIEQYDIAQAIPEDLQPIIDELRELFHPPSEIPPYCPIEHQIVLKEGSDSVNIRPYFYAHFHKDEIEKQVAEMMKVGLI